nr:MAG TPA: hypothetical protein [Caudoviricetes sp.]
MSTTKTTTETAIDNATRFTVLSYYKYHFVSFMREMDKLDEYQRQLETIDRREAASQSLLSQLDSESAKYLADDFRFERECLEQNIADTERFLERKCEKLLVAVAKMQEIGLKVNEEIINKAKVFINA